MQRTCTESGSLEHTASPSCWLLQWFRDGGWINVMHLCEHTAVPPGLQLARTTTLVLKLLPLFLTKILIGFPKFNINMFFLLVRGNYNIQNLSTVYIPNMSAFGVFCFLLKSNIQKKCCDRLVFCKVDEKVMINQLMWVCGHENPILGVHRKEQMLAEESEGA